MINCTKKFLTTLSLVFVIYSTTVCMEEENSFVKAAKACNVPEMQKHLQVMPQKEKLIGLATPIFEALNNRPSIAHIPEEQIAAAVAYLLGDQVTVDGEKYQIPKPMDTPITMAYEASHKRNSDGKLPLHIAATYGHNAAIAHLLKKGIPDDIYSMDNYKSIPLAYAIDGRIESTALLLLNKMTDITKIEPESIAPLLTKALNSHAQKIIDLIFDNKNIFAEYIKKNYTNQSKSIDLLSPLALAIRENQDQAIDWILLVGGETLKRRLNNSLEEKDTSKPNYLLPLACYTSTVSTVKKLVEAGCATNICDIYGSPLSAAAYAGKQDIVDYLISIKAAANQLCNNKYCPLISAVGFHPGINLSQEFVKALVLKLLTAGANINQNGISPDEYIPNAHSPLYLALVNGWLKAATLLKQRGARLSNEEKEGEFPALGIHKNFAEQLLSNKPAPFPEIIAKAAEVLEKNNLISYQWLEVKNDIETNTVKAEAYNNVGWTLLHEAAKQSIPSAETEQGKVLIKYMVEGSMPEFSAQTAPLTEEQEYLRKYLSWSGYTDKITPLSIYFKNDLEKTLDYLARQSVLQDGIDAETDLDILLKLVAKGLKKPTQQKMGRPTEKEAIEHLNSISAKTMIPFILKYNPFNIDITDFDGKTPLHIAAIYDETGETIKVLQDKNASLTAQDFNGATAFHLAAQNNNIISTKALLNWGKDALQLYNKAVDALGKTALHEAALSNAFSIIHLLIQNGWQINQQDKQGNTPLHLAANKGNFEAVKALIENGADITKKNNAGKTAAHLAADKESRLSPSTSVITGKSFTTLEGQKGNHAECFRILIEKDPLLATEKDIAGKTPVAYLYLHNNKEAKNAFLAKKPSLELYQSLIENDLIDAFADLVKKFELPKELDLQGVKKDWAVIAIQEIRNPQPKIEKEIEEKKEKPKTDKDVFVDLAKAFTRI